MPGTSDDVERIAVRESDVTVEKRVDRGRFRVPVVTFTVRATGDRAVRVELTETLPRDRSAADVGFHPAHDSAHWTVDDDGYLTWSRSLEPGRTYRTLYGVAAAEGDLEAVLTVPTVEVVALGSAAEEDSAGAPASATRSAGVDPAETHPLSALVPSGDASDEDAPTGDEPDPVGPASGTARAGAPPSDDLESAFDSPAGNAGRTDEEPEDAGRTDEEPEDAGHAGPTTGESGDAAAVEGASERDAAAELDVEIPRAGEQVDVVEPIEVPDPTRNGQPEAAATDAAEVDAGAAEPSRTGTDREEAGETTRENRVELVEPEGTADDRPEGPPAFDPTEPSPDALGSPAKTVGEGDETAADAGPGAGVARPAGSEAAASTGGRDEEATHARGDVEGDDRGGGEGPALRAKVEYLGKRVNRLDAYTDAIESFLDEAEASGHRHLDALREALAETRRDVAAVEDAVADVRAAQDTQERRLDALEERQSAVVDVKRRVTHLETVVESSADEEQVRALAASVEALRGDVEDDPVTVDVDPDEGELAALAARVDANTAWREAVVATVEELAGATGTEDGPGRTSADDGSDGAFEDGGSDGAFEDGGSDRAFEDGGPDRAFEDGGSDGIADGRDRDAATNGS